MQAHDPRAAGEFGRASDEHAALARRDRFGRVEAEHASGRVQTSDHLAGVGCRQRVRRILDDLERMPLGDLHQWRHGTGETGEVHRDDCPGARRDRRCCGCWINVERVRVDVHEDRSGPVVRHHGSGGSKGMHRHDDLVTRTEPKPLQGEVQPGRGRADRHGFDPAAQEVDEGALEALRLGAGGDPAGAQAVDDLGNFGLAEIGYRERARDSFRATPASLVPSDLRSGAPADVASRLNCQILPASRGRTATTGTTPTTALVLVGGHDCRIRSWAHWTCGRSRPLPLISCRYRSLE